MDQAEIRDSYELGKSLKHGAGFALTWEQGVVAALGKELGQWDGPQAGPAPGQEQRILL